MIAQRLVRTLCPHCVTWREADYVEEGLFNELPSIEDERLPIPVGCERCNQSGFNGRTAIYEVVPVDDAMRRLVHSESAEHELEAYARRLAPSIRQDGLRKVRQGRTTLEEVLRATREE